VSGNGEPMPGAIRPPAVQGATDGKAQTTDQKEPEKKRGFWGKIFGK
jgi:hypothetical protein